ncbi:MAG: hypothetical protein ACXWKC_02870 [Xanthobacteraceae bacterium]
MIPFIIVFLIADAVLILAANFNGIDQAAHVCAFAAPMCNYPVPMFVLGVIASGILVLQKN